MHTADFFVAAFFFFFFVYLFVCLFQFLFDYIQSNTCWGFVLLLRVISYPCKSNLVESAST